MLEESTLCWTRQSKANSTVKSRDAADPGPNQDQAGDGLPAALTSTSAHTGLSTHIFLSKQPFLPPTPLFSPSRYPQGAARNSLLSAAPDGNEHPRAGPGGRGRCVAPGTSGGSRNCAGTCPGARITRTAPPWFQFRFPGMPSSTQKVISPSHTKGKSFPSGRLIPHRLISNF